MAPIQTIWTIVCLTLLAPVLIPALRRIEPEPRIGRVVLDQAGERVTIPLPFHGAAPLFQGIGEYLYVTHDPDSILDSQTISLRWLAGSFFFDLYPKLQVLRHDISLLDQQAANQERLLRLDPSVIFVFQTVAGPLRRVGLPALGLSQPLSTERVFDRTRVYAQALGNPGRANELIAAFKADMDGIRQDLSAIPLPERPTAAQIFILPTGTILLIGHGEADQDAFDVAGVTNASPNERTARVGVEMLLRLDPTLVLLLQNPSPSPNDFMADARWQALGAVQRRSVYRRPLGANGGFIGIVEYSLFARWLAELAHPGQLPPRLRLQVAQKIQQQFGYSLSNEQVDTFLDIAENSSAAYDRFSTHAP